MKPFFRLIFIFVIMVFITAGNAGSDEQQTTGSQVQKEEGADAALTSDEKLSASLNKLRNILKTYRAEFDQVDQLLAQMRKDEQTLRHKLAEPGNTEKDKLRQRLLTKRKEIVLLEQGQKKSQELIKSLNDNITYLENLTTNEKVSSGKTPE